MLSRTFLAASALFFLAAVFQPAQARGFDNVGTDRLVPLADVICNGRVLKLTNTHEKGTAAVPHWEKQTRVPIEYWLARVQVLAPIKGSVAKEIEVRFPQIDSNPPGGGTTIIADGPIQIKFEEGGRYRFFLKAVPGKPWYVSALDGQYDDAFAVQPLSSVEPDDTPLPFTRKAALALAAAYVRQLNPTADTTTVPPDVEEWQGRWSVEFWPPGNRPHEDPAEAHVFIVGNGQVDHGTWVADLCTTAVGDLKPSDLGRKFWIVMQENPPDKKFYTMLTFPPMIVLGTLKKFSATEIELSDVWQYGVGTSAPTWSELAIPTRDIHWYQRLVPSPISPRDR